MLFTGIFGLLAGLAAASTAAVTTIVAATTEAEQADAAPASGAGSAHDAAVTPTAKRNPKRVRPPRTAEGQQEDTRECVAVQVAAGCRCAAVHEQQQQQAEVHVL
ncbi:hypothetical protein QJQ45_017114 [Haematococcus lacustris]|nr:hypothetical protein QJQ45_017114 [Haematococcus lacustris]